MIVDGQKSIDVKNMQKSKGLFVTFNDTIMDCFETRAYYELETYKEYIHFIQIL